MIPTFIILFREVLEISIILSIIIAATRGINGRTRWVWAGIGGGVAGSALVAYFAGAISNAIEGLGQEVFNAGVLFVAVLMIGWTVVWMQSHAKHMVAHIKEVGQKVHDGKLPLYALATVVSLTMWREGAEIVLFMTGILNTSEESLLMIMAGGMAGALAAGTIGFLLYLGLIKFSTRYLFSTTSWLLTLLACGMSAQAAGYLVSADMLPVIRDQLWDSSWLLTQDSILGKIMHAMLGYTERPTGIQAAFYIATFIIIAGLLKITQRKKIMTPATIKNTATAAIILALAGLPDNAYAFKVYTPYVEKGIAEIEMKNRFDFDDRAAEDNFRQHKLAVAYGFTTWWAAELVGEWEKESGHGYSYNATEFENIFQFTDQGEYFVDVGAKLAYEWSHEQNHADKVEAYLLLAKPIGRFTHVANIGVEQEVGDNNNENPEGEIKWMTKYNYVEWVNPGFEYYGEFGEISDMQGWDDQKHRFGPVLYGDIIPGVKYELGWLFGLSKAAEDHALKLNLEYEFPI